MQIQYTVPEDVRTSDIRDFVIHVDDLTIGVRLVDGSTGTVSNAAFLNFWNNTMTASQRTVVRGFVNQLSGLANYKVSVSLADQSGTVIGDLGD